MVVDSMGLLRLGIQTDMTPFTDDDEISNWAKEAMYAARRIGMITAYPDGTITPRMHLTKGAAAAIIDRMIRYMRTELMVEYTDNLVQFAR
jgi:hypothetical protein